MTILVRDSAQYARVNAPNALGMNPAAAERLSHFGVDPRDFSERMQARMRADSVGRRRFPIDRSPKITQELSIDYRDVTTRVILQQAALGAYEAEFIAEEVAPSVFVDQAKGTVILEDSTQERREMPDDGTALGKLNELPSNVLSVNYTTKLRGLEDYQSRYDAQLAPMLISIARLTEKTARKVKRQHEIRTKTALMTATNYNASNRVALAAGHNWNGGASADPISDMLTALSAMYAHCTHAVMSLEAWQAAQMNDQIKAIVASRLLTNEGLLTKMDFGLFFGIENVIIDEQRYTPIGTDTQARLYDSDKISLSHVNPSEMERTFLRNFMIRSGTGGYEVLAWYDEALGPKGSDRVKISYSNDLVPVDDTYGAIITGMRS